MSEAEFRIAVSIDGIQQAAETVKDLEQALRGLKDRPQPVSQAGRRRFEMLCLDLFKVRCAQRPELDAARTLVIGVEGGEIARRYIGKAAAERFPHLNETDRAFAVGLAMGFTTEFLPREA